MHPKSVEELRGVLKKLGYIVDENPGFAIVHVSTKQYSQARCLHCHRLIIRDRELLLFWGHRLRDGEQSGTMRTICLDLVACIARKKVLEAERQKDFDVAAAEVIANVNIPDEGQW